MKTLHVVHKNLGDPFSAVTYIYETYSDNEDIETIMKSYERKGVHEYLSGLGVSPQVVMDALPGVLHLDTSPYQRQFDWEDFPSFMAYECALRVEAVKNMTWETPIRRITLWPFQPAAERFASFCDAKVIMYAADDSGQPLREILRTQ